MSGRVFVDTNILAYAYDVDSGSKHQRARTLVDQLFHSGLGVISTQVLQELVFFVRRKSRRPLSLPETARLVDDLLSWHLVVNDGESVLRALGLEDRYKVSFWDALILQAAERGDAGVIYSEDLSHGQRYGSVRVMNPLK